MCVYGYMHGTASTWRSEDNLQEKLFLFFHHGGLGAQTQVVRFGGHLYQLSHLTGLRSLTSETELESSIQKERAVVTLGLQHRMKDRAEFLFWLRNASTLGL